MNLSSGISSTWLYVCDIIVSYNELVTTWRLPGLCFDNSDIPASLLRALNWFWHDKNYLNCRILIWFLLIIFGISVIILFHFSPVNFFVSVPPVLLSWSWYSCRLHSWLLGGHFPLHIHFRKFLSGTFSLLIFKILKHFDNSMRGQLNNEQVTHDCLCTPYWATVHRVARRPSELQPAVSEEEDSGGLTCPSQCSTPGFLSCWCWWDGEWSVKIAN